MADITEAQARAAFAGQGAVTQSAVDTFAAQMRARGLDPSATLAKHGLAQPSGDGSGQQQSDGSDTVRPHPNASVLSATKIAPPNLGEVTRAFENWKKAGLPEEAFIEAARQDGYELTETGEPGATDAQFDATFAGAAAQDYDLNGIYAGRDMGELAGDLGAVAALDRDMRAVLASMDYPRIMAKSLVSDILDAAARDIPSMNPAARAMWQRDQAAIACRACGVSAEDLTRTAAHALARIPQELRDDLHSAGILDDARVVSALYRHGERLLMREGRR